MIKHIEIKNFKSLRDVSVDLDRLTVLIGRSGTGKSNFVDALRFLRQYVIARGVQQPDRWAAVISATATEPQLAFHLTFELNGIDGDFEFELVFGLPPNQKSAQATSLFRSGQLHLVIETEKLSVAKRILYSQRFGKWEVPPAVARPPSPGQLVLGTVYGVPEVQLAYQFLTRGIGCYDFPSDVLQQQRQPSQSTARLGFLDDGSNYIETFGAITDDLSHLDIANEIIAAIRKLSPTLKSIEIETQNRQEIFVGHQIGEAPVLTLSLTQQSEGLRRFLAQMLALHQNPRKQVLISEEPEKGIYPGALNVLANYFVAASERSTQIVLTTHNPLLLDYLPVESMRVVHMQNYETHIGHLAQDQVQSIREHLMRPGELLTVEEARVDVREIAGSVAGD